MIVAVVCARMNSARFFGKVLAPFAGSTILERVMAATQLAGERDWRYLVATTDQHEDDRIAEVVRSHPGWDLWRGAVCPLTRFMQVVGMMELGPRDVLVRLTADDFGKVPVLVRHAVDTLLEPRFPDLCVADTNHGLYAGLGAEAFRVASLKHAASITPEDDREHVTKSLTHISGLPITFSVDHREDLARWERFAA